MFVTFTVRSCSVAIMAISALPPGRPVVRISEGEKTPSPFAVTSDTLTVPFQAFTSIDSIRLSWWFHTHESRNPPSTPHGKHSPVYVSQAAIRPRRTWAIDLLAGVLLRTGGTAQAGCVV